MSIDAHELQEAMQRRLTQFPNSTYEIGESSSSNARLQALQEAVLGVGPNMTTHVSIDRSVNTGLRLADLEDYPWLNPPNSIDQRAQRATRTTRATRPNPFVTGESSSTPNVRMRMTTEVPQPAHSVYPTRNPNGNPSQPREMRNAVYDPSFEMQGLPLDPHMRLMMFRNRSNQPQ